MGNSLLSLYFLLVEALGRALPPTKIYPFIHLTGHWFRPHSYKPLKEACLNNLKPFFASQAPTILREILHFEVRLVLENLFLRRRDTKRIKASFENLPPPIPAPAIIITGHFFNYWLLLESFYLSGQEVVLIMGEEPHLEKASSPLEKSGAMMWQVWRRHIKYILMKRGQTYQKCSQALRRGDRLFLLFDVPRPGGQKIPFLGGEIQVPTGWWRLAQELNVPVFAFWPSFSSCRSRYTWRLEPLVPLDSAINQVFDTLEKIILKTPALWMGWTYLSQLRKPS